jgi:hypothetical protein
MNSALLQKICRRYHVQPMFKTENGIVGPYGTLAINEDGLLILHFTDCGKSGEAPLSGGVRTRFAISEFCHRGAGRKNITRTGETSFIALLCPFDGRGTAKLALRLMGAIPRPKTARLKKPPAISKCPACPKAYCACRVAA